MDNFFIFCAQYLFLASFFLALVSFLRLPRKAQIQIAVIGLLCGVLSYSIALIAGQLYDDPRPFVAGHFKPLIAHDTENGFPSDHVLMLSQIAAVFSLYSRKVASILWVITAVVGYARVYAGVHHYIDVIASMLIVIIALIVTYRIVRGPLLNRLTSAINSTLA
jgi:undecaprenyl-diphosphatase